MKKLFTTHWGDRMPASVIGKDLPLEIQKPASAWHQSGKRGSEYIQYLHPTCTSVTQGINGYRLGDAR